MQRYYNNTDVSRKATNKGRDAQPTGPVLYLEGTEM